MAEAITRYTDHLDLIGPDRTGDAAVLVMALVHDEVNLVPAFLDHYRAFGDVTFLIVDDRSGDGSGDLLAAQGDVTVLNPRDGSTYAADKREWRGQALDRVAGGGRWCLVPDIDEHLVWAGWPERGFEMMLGDLEAEGAEALYATMVDMYADAPLAGHVYEGGDLRAAFPYFDDPRKDPAGIWMERAARAFLRDWPTPPMMVRGGMRQRLFQEVPPLRRLRIARHAFRTWDHDPQGRAAFAWATATRAFTRVRRMRQPLNLTKVPLLRWRPGSRFSGGAHAIRPARRLARERAALLHYPITRGMAGIEHVVARGQHADGCSYYRSLLAASGLNPYYDGSTRMRNVDDLVPFVFRPPDRGATRAGALRSPQTGGLDMTEEITREDGPSGGRYLLRRAGAEAEMSYSRLSPERIIVDHTGVPDAMRGTGVGLLLAERLVADARTEGVRAVPLCPFVKAQAKRHPEWSDVIEGA